MDQPFHFSRYLRELRKRWLLIVIPPIVALIAVIIFNVITPVTYSASATLIAPREALAWRWENRVYDIADNRFDWRTEVMPLVTTQAVTQQALDLVAGSLTTPMDARELAAATSVSQGAGSLFTITVKAANGEDATLLANAIAMVLPDIVSNIYIGEETAFQEALDLATTKFDEYDLLLNEFRGDTGVGFGMLGDLTTRGEDELFGAHSAIKQELVLKNSDRAGLKNALDRVDMVLTSAAEGQSAMHTSLLYVPELKRYGLDEETLQTLTSTDSASLLVMLPAIRDQISADYEALSADVTAVQYDHADQIQYWENLLRVRGVWQESITALERKMAEVQFRRIVEGGRISTVSPASVPTQPSQPNWPLSLGLALVGGLLGGLLLAIISVYLSEPEQP